MNIKSFCIGLGVCCLLWTSSSLAGTVTFGSGETAFDIEFVTVGAPGNAPDLNDPSRPAGGVDYVYRIGKYEISRQIIERANIAGNLGITLQDMTGMGGNGPDKPATGINWFEAARFVNWLNQHDEYPPAYKFVDGQFQLWTPQDSGYDDANPFRNTEARYFLPTFHEWYKAAFYDPRADAYYTYPTGSNRPPSPTTGGTDPETAVYGQHTTTGPANVTQAGGLSPIGTMAQGGNAWEWEETEYDMHNDSVFGRRALRGGSWTNDVNHIARWYRNQFQPAEETWFKSFGFRVASFVESPAGNGDFDRNGIVDVTDIDQLSRAIAGESTDLTFDLEGDGDVDRGDLSVWIHDLKQTWLGDANLDRVFDTGDLALVFRNGMYERDLDAGWSDGDWNADLRADSRDLIAALQDGGYERGPRRRTQEVPEPGPTVSLLGMLLMTVSRRRDRSRRAGECASATCY